LNAVTDLTSDQTAALEAILEWQRSRSSAFFVMAGYAGTGKTTLLSLLRNKLRKDKIKTKVAFCTFTGKAAHVLRQKLVEQHAVYPGDTCSTIHSLIYKAEFDAGGAVSWRIVDELKQSLIVIDEASMVPEKIWNDLLSFGIPMLAVGDHGQLPPIDDNFDLMRNPDIRLEKIHRQAAENPIIDIAHKVRQGIVIKNGSHGQQVKKISRQDEYAMESIGGLLSDSSVDRLVLCGKNKTRVALNNNIRRLMDYESEHPQLNERVICLKNNYIHGIFNGMQGYIESLSTKNDSYYDVVIDFDGERKEFTGVAVRSQFGNLKTLSFKELKEIPDASDSLGGPALFDWGYALTVHKAQGSEADQVILFEERMGFYDDEMWSRWLYTAVTRAKNELYWVSD
jgi:exodeoxyribonuclease-5